MSANEKISVTVVRLLASEAEDGTFELSAGALARDIGVGERTARGLLRSLVAKDFIERVDGGGRGARCSARFRLAEEAASEEGAAEAAAEEDDGEPPIEAGPDRQKKPPQEVGKNYRLNWGAYPSGQSKQNLLEKTACNSGHQGKGAVCTAQGTAVAHRIRETLEKTRGSPVGIQALAALQAAGWKPHQICDARRSHKDESILKAVRYVLARSKNVANPGGYLMECLKGGWHETEGG